MVAPPPKDQNQPLVVDETRPPASDPRVHGFGDRDAAQDAPPSVEALREELGFREVVIPDTDEARASARALFRSVAAASERTRQRAFQEAGLDPPEARRPQAPVP